MKMSQYDNNNTGALFKADKKSDKHPDYTGNCEINGVHIWMSAWTKTSKNGQKFMSFSFNPKENQPHQQPPQQSTEMAQAKAAVMSEWDKGPGPGPGPDKGKGDGFGDDDIPF